MSGRNGLTQDERTALKQGCQALRPDIDPSYGYEPHMSAGVIFTVLFALITIGHLFELIRKRRWTSGLLFTGAIVETVGWAGRSWAAKCVYNSNAFMIQIVTLIIAPVFLSAALYVLLGLLIIHLGRESSILSARWYAIIFCTCDFISLVAQGAGGGIASVESGKIGGDVKKGSNIMLAGIVFQLVTMTLFGFFGADFLKRSIRSPALTSGMRKVLLAMLISFTAIYIRSIYRVVELAQGWNGYIITHEVFFCVLDALMMVIASGVFNVLDPARLMPKTTIKDARTGMTKGGKDRIGSSSDTEMASRY